jgi:transcriptional regulator with XRE-family HTH domain
VREPEAVTSARCALGIRLATYRRAAGLTQMNLASLIAFSRSTIANVETGRQHVPRGFWESADAAVHAGGALVAGCDELEAAARRARVQPAVSPAVPLTLPPIYIAGRPWPAPAPDGASAQADLIAAAANQARDHAARAAVSGIGPGTVEHMGAGDPVISVDAKKKENVGGFKNGGREWQPEGAPERVNVHDFIAKKLGKVTPYGVYDVAGNTGWVSVGTDHDTAAFAVATIRTWWDKAGQAAYPDARRLLITADGGGSNGYRTRLWKTELAALAAETGLQITVCHLPPGTSKWNKIEHRLFSHISMNWRGRPLTSHEVIVQTIAATTTRTG